jgi:hypothetical protein
MARRWGTFRWGTRRWGEVSPETRNALLDGPAWEQPVVSDAPYSGVDTFGLFDAGDGTTGSSGFGGGQDLGLTGPGFDGRAPWIDDDGNAHLPDQANGTPELIELSADRTVMYSIEIRDSAKVKIMDVSDWFAGKISMKVDEAGALEFSVVENAAVDYLHPPYWIWVRERHGYLFGQFEIDSVTSIGEGDGAIVEVVGLGGEAQLGKEPIISYSSEGKKPIIQIVQELLALQVREPKIGLAFIWKAIWLYEVQFSCADTTLLDALKQLQNLVPWNHKGFIYVDAWHRLRWVRRIGTVGMPLERGDAVTGVRYRKNYRDMATRLWMYGAGQDPRYRCKLTDPGADQPEEYIEQNVATYGVLPMEKVDNRITDPETLLKAAQRILAEVSEPIVEIEVEALDLAKADMETPPCIEDLYMGSRYWLRDPSLDIDFGVEVVGVTYNMDQPLLADLHLTNRRRGLEEVVEEILNQMAKPLIVDEGDRYPNIVRTYPLDTEVPPKDMDWRNNEGEAQWFDEPNEEWRDATQVDLSEDDPQLVQIQTADPGSSGLAADAGHKHNLLLPWATEPADPIADQSSAGSAERAARENHKHRLYYTGASASEIGTPAGSAAEQHFYLGRVTGFEDVDYMRLFQWNYDTTAWEPVCEARMTSGATLNDLKPLHGYPTWKDGDLAYTTDDDLLYVRSNAQWKKLPYVYVAASKATLPSTAEVDSLGRVYDPNHLDPDDGRLYKRNAANDAWEWVGARITTGVDLDNLLPLDGDFQAGDLAYTTDDDRGYVYTSDETWLCYTHIV